MLEKHPLKKNSIICPESKLVHDNGQSAKHLPWLQWHLITKFAHHFHSGGQDNIVFTSPFGGREIIWQGTCPGSKPLILLSLCSCVSVYKLAPSPVLLVSEGLQLGLLVFRVPWGAEELRWPAHTVPKGQTPEGACLSWLPGPSSFPHLVHPFLLLCTLLLPSHNNDGSGYRALTRSVAQYSRAQTVTLLATARHKPSPPPSLTALPGTSPTPFCVWATQPVCLPQPLWNLLEAHLLASLHHDWQPAPPPSRAWAVVSSHRALGTWEGPKTWLE